MRNFLTTSRSTSLLALAALCMTSCVSRHGAVGSSGVGTPVPGAPTPDATTTPVLQPPTPTPAETEEAASGRSSAVGKPAPDFTLPDAFERPTSLTRQRGKWLVLYFYPGDDTPGCTCQATEFTALLKKFDALNAKVIGVSPDSPATHQYFMRKYGLNFPLLSDPSHDVMRDYGAWLEVKEGPAAPGRVLRSTYLIDPGGKVAWHWPEVIPQGHAERVKEKLSQLSAS